MQSELLKLIENFDVISFDVFDTLLLRPYLKPRDLWVRIGGEEFAAERARCDRGGFDTIHDTYQQMDPKWREMLEIELAEERRCLTANPEMLEVWQRAGELGKKRVIASDMYLPRQFLEDVLRANGVDGWDVLYVSCDCGARKDTGEMFRKLVAESKVSPNRILHIGDNLNSDVVIPKQIGITAHHYRNVADRFVSENQFLKHFLSADGSLEARCLVASASVAWHRYSVLHPNCPYWARIGALIGGVFGAAYVAFIVKEARARNIRRMLFVARDGYALEKMFNVAAPEIKTQYVYAPRLVRTSNDSFLHKEYADYINGLGIGEGESIGVVDTVSLSFSAQHLIAEALGRNVWGFSFVALAQPVHGVTFLYTPRMTLRWAHLVEQLFMANEGPIEAVMDGKPVYKAPMPLEENRRLEVFAQLVDAEIGCATYLLENGVEITPVRLLDYIEAFIDSMTDVDCSEFSVVKNSDDTHSEKYSPIIRPEYHLKTVWWTYKKIPIYKRHYGREGLKMVTRDKLFGLFEFRRIEEDM